MFLSLSHIRLGTFSILLAGVAVVMTGGKAPSSAAPPPPSLSPRTEQQWIVESVGQRAAALLSGAGLEPIAGTRSGPGENPASALPVFVEGRRGLRSRSDLVLERGVWEPASYLGLWAKSPGPAHPAAGEPAPAGAPALVLLANPYAELLRFENVRISRWLQRTPRDPAAHEEAALLLGTLGLRENSGSFYDVREILNRLTSHLVAAQVLRGGEKAALGLPGRVAHLLGTLLSEAAGGAEGEIKSLQSEVAAHPELQPWLRAARLRQRTDWRLAESEQPETLLERLEQFRALNTAATAPAASTALRLAASSDLPDWPRMILAAHPTVGEQRRYVAYALPFELEEIGRFFPALAGVSPLRPEFAATLNAAPAPAGSSEVLEAGLLAAHLQRHLCHALERTEQYLRVSAGQPAQAEAFRQTTQTMFGSLRLYPQVAVLSRRAEALPEAIASFSALANQHPEEISPTVWSATQAHLSPAANTALGTWFRAGLPAGTLYQFSARRQALPAVQRLTREDLARWQQRSPWHFGVAEQYLTACFPGRPSAQLFHEVLGRFVSYRQDAWTRFPQVVRDQPEVYTTALRKLAELDPHLYATLGAYHARHGEQAEAAAAYLTLLSRPVEGPPVLEAASWLARFYAARGEREKALGMASLAVRTGSAAGAQVRAEAEEMLGDLPAAEAHFEQIEETFDDPLPLLRFCARQAAGNPSFARRYEAVVRRLFPRGIRVETARKDQPPVRGVAVRRASAPVAAAGLRANDVVVAVNGQEAGTIGQYSYLSGNGAPALALTVYREGSYQEVHVREADIPPLSDMATYHE